MGGGVAQLVEHWIATLPTRVRFSGAAGDFSPTQLSVQTLLQCLYILCAIVCIYICGQVKDPVVHVGVRWIMETLKHPA